MEVTFVPVKGDLSQGIPALKEASAKAAYSECVRVDLPGHSLLFISGQMGERTGSWRGAP